MDAVIRPVTPADRPVVLAMAARLQEGVASWRDPTAVTKAVEGWVADSLDHLDDTSRAMFVADLDGEVIGFVSASERRQFSGETDTYIGELVMSRTAERHGMGTALVLAATDWGRSRGCPRISVDTGAGNAPARVFYQSLGFQRRGRNSQPNGMSAAGSSPMACWRC